MNASSSAMLAANRIKAGWFQKSLTGESVVTQTNPGHEQYCVVTAVGACGADDFVFYEAARVLGIPVSHRNIGQILDALAAWNDAPERTHEEVIAMFMLVHARLSARGL